MTRDRPAAGGQDSTLDGEFPGDFSGGGGAARSRTNPRKISAVYGTDFHQGGFNTDVGFTGSVNTKNFGNNLYYSYVSPSPVMGIYDDIVTSQLSGIYRFDTPYMMDYTFGMSTSISQTLTATDTVAATTSASITGGNIGAFRVAMQADPSGTGTIAYQELSLAMNINNLSATYFSAYGNLPTIMSVQNKAPLNGTNRIVTSRKYGLNPGYIIEVQRSNRILDVFPVVPNSSTNFSLQISASASATTGVSLLFSGTAYQINSFSTVAIQETITSF